MELAEILLFCLLASAIAQVAYDDYEDEDLRLPENATGRPMPPELVAIFKNKTDRDQDIEVCMTELFMCHKMKHEVSRKVCGRHGNAMKTFKDLCDLIYENCKAPVIEGVFSDIQDPNVNMHQTYSPDLEVWQYSHDGECDHDLA